MLVCSSTAISAQRRERPSSRRSAEAGGGNAESLFDLAFDRARKLQARESGFPVIRESCRFWFVIC